MALLLTFEVIFCKGVEKIDGTAEKATEFARNDVTHKKMIFLPDITTGRQQIYAGNTTTINDTKEKPKSYLADDALDNDTNDDVSSRRMNSLQRFVVKTYEDQRITMNRLNDILTDLQLKVYSRAVENPCKWYKDEILPTDCSAAFKITGGGGGENGVHKIRPPGTNVLAFHVYCLEDDKAGGQPWTVIQRRLYGEEDFNRNWHAYKTGFGSLDDEFWLGLDHIYTLTHSARHELRITLTNWDDEVYVAHYDNFLISDEASNYTIKGIGTHGGNISDSFKKFHNGQMFSTFDRDNDSHKRKHCAEYFRSGWWYHRCLLSNLNGPYPNADETFSKQGTAKGIYWGSRQSTSYRDSEMAIRIRK